MTENFSGGEQVEVSAPAQEIAPDTESQQEPEGNVWDEVINNTYEYASEDENEATLETDENPAEETETETDDEIPAEEEETDAAKETDSSVEEKSEKKPRSKNFKELQESNADWETRFTEQETELTGIKSKYETLDAALEEVGGADQVHELLDNQKMFIDPARYKEAVDFVGTLPQSALITAEILNRSFDVGEVKLTPMQKQTALANRVQVVNGALARDFGLTENLTQTEMAAAFEWIAARVNKDKSEWMSDISDELELLAPDEGTAQNRETQRQIAELKQQLEEQKNGKTEDVQPEQFDPEKVLEALNSYETETLESVAGEVLKEYKTSFDKLSSIESRMLQSFIRMELTASSNFMNLADYIAQNKTDHVNAKHLAGQYRNQMKALVRSAASVFLGKPAPKTPAKPTNLTPKGKTAIKPTKAKDDKNPWAEYQ